MEMRPNECVYMFIAYTCLLRIHVYCVYMFIIYCLLNANANMRRNECVFFQYTILGACTLWTIIGHIICCYYKFI